METGRGYPNIDSLKGLAQFFGVSIDALLSGQEALSMAQEEHKQKRAHFRRLVFGLLDLSTALFFFLPLFGQKVGGQVSAVALPALTETALYLKIAYWAVLAVLVAWGLLTVAVHRRYRVHIPSLLINGLGVLLFVISPQPYAAAFLLAILTIKVLLLMNKQ